MIFFPLLHLDEIIFLNPLDVDLIYFSLTQGTYKFSEVLLLLQDEFVSQSSTAGDFSFIYMSFLHI